MNEHISLPEELKNFIDDESIDFSIQTNYSIPKKQSRWFMLAWLLVITVIFSTTIRPLLNSRETSVFIIVWMFITIFGIVGMIAIGYGFYSMIPQVYYFVWTPKSLIRYSSRKILSISREEFVNVKQLKKKDKMNIISLEIKNNRAPEYDNPNKPSPEFMYIISEEDIAEIAQLCRQKIYK